MENAYAYLDARLTQGRPQMRKKLENNTYAVRLPAGSYVGGVGRIKVAGIGVKLHETYVVIALEDGTEIIQSGGWKTPTTKARIERYSSARVGSDRGVWRIYSADPIDKTPDRIQKCRMCKGSGKIIQAAYSYQPYGMSEGEWKPQGGPIPHPETRSECWRCRGEGRANYGGNNVYPLFVSGLLIRNGKLVDPPDLGVSKLPRFAVKFTAAGRKPTHAVNARYPAVGKWSAPRTPVLCSSGWHVPHLESLGQWADHELWLVEVKGRMVVGYNKSAHEYIRFVRKLDAYPDRHMLGSAALKVYVLAEIEKESAKTP